MLRKVILSLSHFVVALGKVLLNMQCKLDPLRRVFFLQLFINEFCLVGKLVVNESLCRSDILYEV